MIILKKTVAVSGLPDGICKSASFPNLVPGMLKWSGFDDQPQFLTSCYPAKKVLTGAAYRGTVKTFSGFLA